jgi:polyhydroxyalkanoate synthase
VADEDKKRIGGFTFDAYWEQDLPAVIAKVKAVSGAESVDYVGHSMGGMVLYAYLSQGGKGIHAAATLGSPSRLDLGTGFEGLLVNGARMLPRGWMVPSSVGAFLASPFQGMIEEGPFQKFFYNSENTKLESWKRLMSYGTANVSGAVAAQLVSIIATGAFTCGEGNHDFRKGLEQVTTPVLVVAARLDRVALSPAVYDAYRALGGAKEWLLISRANGAVAEYGHMDLVIGERAPTEVWTPVLEFLNRHEPKELP